MIDSLFIFIPALVLFIALCVLHLTSRINMFVDSEPKEWSILIIMTFFNNVKTTMQTAVLIGVPVNV